MNSFKKLFSMKRKAFTLIELLVVIAIIWPIMNQPGVISLVYQMVPPTRCLQV
ncbi:MAG: prepilin-type N-terminal cleavage/methylation domain-containing protein [Planctomycetia bacterium]|nr:prepilin-type N-terminal cleavage/methylation domain-containing protein [Planctomycetia bacterium]